MVSGFSSSDPGSDEGSPHRAFRLESAANRWLVALTLPLLTVVVALLVDTDRFRIGTGFVAVVVLVALVSGVRAATVSAVITGVCFWWGVVPPEDGWGSPWPEAPLAMAVYAISCGSVLWIVRQRDRGLDALDAERAAVLAAERGVAARLQEALLPSSSVPFPGHDLGACYRPASDAHRVGGDWWDVVPLGDARVAVVLGDVSGHGVESAAVMAELRNALRGLLVHGASPAAALDTTSRLLSATRPDQHATAVVAVIDAASATLTYCRAGHPPPLLDRGGRIERLEGGHGLLLGVDHIARTDEAVRIEPPTRMVLYSDGLVELPGRPIEAGIDRLESALGDIEGPAVDQAEELVVRLAGNDRRDDICVLVVVSDPANAAGASTLVASG